MSAVTRTSTIRSLFDWNTTHIVQVETLATDLGFKIELRMPSQSIAEVLTDVFTELKITGDIEGMAASIEGEITTDTTGRDALHVAVSAADTVLEELFGSTVTVTGWVPGEQKLIGGEIFELTGRACVNCGVNPEANARGFRGVRCANVAECGHEVRF